MIDWILQARNTRAPAGVRPYENGTAFVAVTKDGRGRIARLSKRWAEIRNDFRVFGLLAERDYSLVQIQDKHIGALIAISAAKIYRVPIFYWLAYPHGEASLHAARTGVARYALFHRLRGILQRWLLYRVILPACVHVFVQSEQMRLDVAREGIAAEKMTPVPSSVNLGEIDAVSAQLARHSANRDSKIIYLGTLLRERRLDFLVRCMSQVLTRVPDAKLVFVGSGETPEDEDWLWREAWRVGVRPAMSITGRLPTLAAWRQVHEAAVCVSPYCPVPILLSTSPAKLVEYMALGKAVVASEHPEQSEVIKESGCGLVCAWDEAEFSQAIVRLLRDPALRERMGRAGRRFVERRRTHSIMADKVERRYLEVVFGYPDLEPRSGDPARSGAASVAGSRRESRVSGTHDA